MADNISVTPGSGKIVASDEVTDGTLGTVQVQLIKLMDGTLGSTNKLIVNSDGSLNVKLETQSIEIGKVDQGAPNTAANGWPMMITDGTHTATVKSDGGLVVDLISSTPSGSALPSETVWIGGSDGTDLQGLRATNTTPTGTEQGLITRNIPSGTQPISGTVAISGTVPVSGTFFQATQPVSLASAPTTTVIQPTGANLHVVVDAAPTTAVTGTFFQATQPVSAVSLPLPTGAATNTVLTNGTQETQLVDGAAAVIGPAQAISGTNYLPVVLAASGTSGSAVPTRTIQVGGSDGTDIRAIKTSATGVVSVDGSAVIQPVSGTVTANQGMANATPWNANISQVGGTAVVAEPKGAQAANFFPTMDAKDSGRTPIIFYIDRIAGVITTEALSSFSQNKGGSVTSGTSYTVSAGKTLRIQSFHVTILDSTTTAVNGRVRIRAAATVVASSPIYALVDLGNFTGTAAAGSGQGFEISYADGLEIPAGMQVGISQIVSSASSTVTVGIVGFEY